MAKKKSTVEIYQMVCKDCGARNYVTKLKRDHKSLSLKKYCSAERKHTVHGAKKT